jgi:hypothetical protein
VNSWNHISKGGSHRIADTAGTEKLRQRILPNGYHFGIETTMSPSLADYTSGLDLVTVMWQDTPLKFQARVNMAVYELNGEITELLNSRGQRGHFKVEADESEVVDPN